jgi:hypothetical protein
MMIAAKNGAMTTAIAAMTTDQKARGPGNFIDADQMFEDKYLFIYEYLIVFAAMFLYVVFFMFILRTIITS